MSYMITSLFSDEVPQDLGSQMIVESNVDTEGFSTDAGAGG